MPALGSTCAVAVVGQVVATGGQVRKVLNVFVYRNPNPGGAGTLANFIAAFDANVWSIVAPLLHTSYTAVRYDGWFPGTLLPGAATAFVQTNNGGVAGVRLPLQLAVNTVMRTASRGKSYMGLKRFGPIAESQVVGDELTPAAVTAWGAAVTAMASTFVDSFGRTWIPVVFSRALSTFPPPVFQPIGDDILQVQLNRTLGFCRHRRERTVR